MKNLTLDITINAPRENVWDAIVTDAKYRAWTAVFYDGSYFEGGWNKGEAIHFLAVNSEGKKEGMVSEIAESVYPEFISIRHRGYVVDGVEDTTSEKVKEWAPSYENYKLEKLAAHQTRFTLNMDVAEAYYDSFKELWPKALAKLKEVSENS